MEKGDESNLDDMAFEIYIQHIYSIDTLTQRSEYNVDKINRNIYLKVFSKWILVISTDEGSQETV